MYIIKKATENVSCICSKGWEAANRADINVINWEKFRDAPNSFAKLLYDDSGIYIRLETDENPLLARHREQNSDVCSDSCMEFFLRPNENDPRYLNFEFNPFGTMYMSIRTSRDDFSFVDKDRNYFNVKSYVDDKKWVLSFFIPFELIDGLFGSHTKTMYGNLYKCGEDTEIVHFVSYYPVPTTKPDFHRPEYFGEFVLE